MCILGIDPGYGRLGFGVVTEVHGDLRMIVCGCFETSKDDAHAKRLNEVSGELLRLIALYQPELVGVEKLFFQKNVRTAMKVAEARGVILQVAAARGLRVVECSPQEVKLAVSGYGNADKRQVQSMVTLLLGLSTTPKPDDAADALAVAICASRMSHAYL